jgi:regulator of sirC expression with transglutaminase-like and TPR domain
MKSADAIEMPETLSEAQRAALLNLLTDEDPAIYQPVRQRILSCGPSVTSWLRPHTLSREPVLRRRAQEIVRHFQRQSADTSFLGFCLKHGEDLDLETGIWMLAQTQYPDINIEAYEALLDTYASALQERIDSSKSAKEILKAMQKYLFAELGFRGNESNYYDPENNYLNRVMDRRTGNPINLCLLYLLLGRRLRLPIAGIGLPGHFVCRYQSTAEEVYIDAFNGGRLLTKADCVKYLVHGHYGMRDDVLVPVSPRRLLLRVCANLHQIYLHLEASDETTRLQRYLVALAR